MIKKDTKWEVRGNETYGFFIVEAGEEFPYNSNIVPPTWTVDDSGSQSWGPIPKKNVATLLAKSPEMLETLKGVSETLSIMNEVIRVPNNLISKIDQLISEIEPEIE